MGPHPAQRRSERGRRTRRAPTTSRRPRSRYRRRSRRTTSCCACRTREIRLLQDSVARYERSLQLTRNQYDVGVASRGDVVQAEAQLMSTRAQALEGRVEQGAARARDRHPRSARRPPISASPPRPRTCRSRRCLRRCLPSCSSGVRTSPPPNAGWPRPTRRSASRRRRSIRRRVFSPAAASTSASRAASRSPSSFSTAGCATRTKAQATAAYEETIANYRQTVLGALRDVEDNLAAVRILEERSRRARRRGEGGARIGDDHEQPVPRGHRHLSVRRRRAGRGARQRTRRARHSRADASSPA